MVGGIQTGIDQSVLNEGLVGQSLQGGAGLGNQNKQSVCQIQPGVNCILVISS